MGLHCRTCRCSQGVPEETLIAWVRQGVKAEGMDYFCKPRCQSCPSSPRCPRDPYCRVYVNETESA